MRTIVFNAHRVKYNKNKMDQDKTIEKWKKKKRNNNWAEKKSLCVYRRRFTDLVNIFFCSLRSHFMIAVLLLLLNRVAR